MITSLDLVKKIKGISIYFVRLNFVTIFATRLGV
jgi:hypothetical protein